MYDVLVCGAGPAGSIAATVLARGGARVLVVDRARFPRDKLCGDSVNPGALTILRRLGLDAAAGGGLPVNGMLVTAAPAVQVIGRYGAGHQGRALRRSVLDAALLQAAAGAGARVEQGVMVKGPLVDEGRVRGLVLHGRNGQPLRVTAPMVIAADGASSRLARALRLARHARAPRRWAVGAYFEDVADTSDLGEMHIRAGHYIGVAPLPGGLTNACLVTADRAALRQIDGLLVGTIRRDPLLADRFARARPVTPSVCLGPLGVECSACGVPGLLLAGDSAGFIDPMTGDGLRFAFRGAELAAHEALRALEHGPEDADRRLMQARRREFASKWRFNRVLRSLVSSTPALRVATRTAAVAPGWLGPVIRYAGDLRAA